MQIEPGPVQYGILGSNLIIMVVLLEMRVKVGLLWKDYLQRKKLNGN